MNQAAIIADQFLKEHNVEIHSKSVFPGWHSKWIVDGRHMGIKAVKRLLLPEVMEYFGPNPKALKKVIWRIMAQVN